MCANGQRDPEVQLLLDKQQIYEVIARFCRGADRLDEELMRSVYWPEATDRHGAFEGLGWDFAKRLASNRVEEVLPASSRIPMYHLLGSVLIDVKGDRAHSEAYWVAWLFFQRDGMEWYAFAAGRYLDRFERRQGEWKIARRIVVHDCTYEKPAPEPWIAQQHFVQGQPSLKDLVYRHHLDG